MRTHGEAGPLVIVLHGGPAAAGEAEPMARGLSRHFRVIEPFQRGSGQAALSVAVHVDDLHRLVQDAAEDAPPLIVGESWGAMLALAYTAAHPQAAVALVLVGCGTFDPASRARMSEILHSRMDSRRRAKLRALAADVPDEGERLRARFSLMADCYDYDPIPDDPQLRLQEPFDASAHQQTWNDMLRLQDEGTYPAAFARISCPVLMLHGDYDPHPGPMIRDCLKAVIPHLEYHELAHCGHRPWGERQARKEFFMTMTNWLLLHARSAQ